MDNVFVLFIISGRIHKDIVKIVLFLDVTLVKKITPTFVITVLTVLLFWNKDSANAMMDYFFHLKASAIIVVSLGVRSVQKSPHKNVKNALIKMKED